MLSSGISHVQEALRASLSSLTQEHGELEADLRNYRAQLEPLQSVEKNRQRLESECLDLREAEKEKQKAIDHLTAALKELDFERSKLREYLIRYETEYAFSGQIPPAAAAAL